MSHHPAPRPTTAGTVGTAETAGTGSSPAPDTADAIVRRLLADDCLPYALLRRRAPGHDADTVEVLIGPVTEVTRLADIPLPAAAPGAGGGGGGEPVADALALLPFRQIRERGFQAHDDGTPLAVLHPTQTYALPLADVLAALPDHPVRVHDGAFDVDDAAYAAIVRRVIDTEIGTGEGANFVIRRTFEGQIHDFGTRDALALFRRLLAGERGAYWTYVVHTGERTLVGASPEVHVRMSGETVVMNPISGTYRYPQQGPDVDGLLAFLADRKEVEELSMVVDEELKMMCAVGDRGGVVIGPRLREMAHLAHTEYELRGRSTLDVREVLRQTMFAATVTGSPVQNACRVIARHEPRGADGRGRGYYAGALALIGRDAGGARTLDSPILIRTADIDPGGRLRVPVGATLVRHSDPLGEVAETHAKAAGVLTALGVRAAPARTDGAPAPRLADDPRVQAALAARRADLAPFWLRMRTPETASRTAAGTPADGLVDALVIDGEDTFTSMLAHLLATSGLRVTVRGWAEPGLREEALAHRGPIVLGPGPGDPLEAADPKMRLLRALAADLVRGHRYGLLGVCLGHELIAAELGLDLVRKRVPAQGAQERIDFFGRPETVGFYNTFTAHCDESARQELAAHGIEVSRDAASGEVHALRGPGFGGLQFHPESVLTLAGAALVAEELALARQSVPLP